LANLADADQYFDAYKLWETDEALQKIRQLKSNERVTYCETKTIFKSKSETRNCISTHLFRKNVHQVHH